MARSLALPTTNPLGAQAYREIQQAMAIIQQKYEECELAKSALIPCDELRNQLDELQEAAAAMKRAYFPDRA